MTTPDPITEAAALRLLGQRIGEQRLHRNISQEHLAGEAGVSKRTVVRIERGESTQLSNLARVLRALGLLHALADLVPPLPPSPLAELRREATNAPGRRRASRRGAPNDDAGAEGPGAAGGWTWGDERRPPTADERGEA